MFDRRQHDPVDEAADQLGRFSNALMEEGRYGHTIQMDVMNNLSWAIAGIRIGYKVFSEGRSVAWERDDFSLSNSGGIEPGETREIRTSLHGIPSIAPKELIATAEVLDVADPQARQLIRDVLVIGDNWSDEVSDLPCEWPKPHKQAQCL